MTKNETLYIDVINNYGQMSIEDAEKFIARKATEGIVLAKDFSPKMFVTDELDSYISNPCNLRKGYCWVITEGFSSLPAPTPPQEEQAETLKMRFVDPMPETGELLNVDQIREKYGDDAASLAKSFLDKQAAAPAYSSEGLEGHTAGEWIADGLAVDSPQFEICVVSQGYDQDGNKMNWEEAKANAALIASAPRLAIENR